MNLIDLSLNQRHVLSMFDSRDQLTVSDVCKHLQLPRPTAKQVLQRLKELGYLERHGVNKGSFYTRLGNDQVKDEFGNAVVSVYQGRKGFERLFSQLQESLKKDDYYWSFAFRHEYYDPSLIQILLTFHFEITRKGVEDKTIVHSSVKDVVAHTYRNIPDLQIRYSDQEVPVGTLIMRGKVVNLVWGDKPVAVVMYSEVLVRHYQDFFKAIWEKSK